MKNKYKEDLSEHRKVNKLISEGIGPDSPRCLSGSMAFVIVKDDNTFYKTVPHRKYKGFLECVALRGEYKKEWHIVTYNNMRELDFTKKRLFDKVYYRASFLADMYTDDATDIVTGKDDVPDEIKKITQTCIFCLYVYRQDCDSYASYAGGMLERAKKYYHHLQRENKVARSSYMVPVTDSFTVFASFNKKLKKADAMTFAGYFRKHYDQFVEKDILTGYGESIMEGFFYITRRRLKYLTVNDIQIQETINEENGVLKRSPQPL